MKKLTLTIFTLLLLSLAFVSCADKDATKDGDDMVVLTIEDLANWDDNATWSGTARYSYTGDKEFIKKIFYGLTDEDLILPDTPIKNVSFSSKELAENMSYKLDNDPITDKDIPNPLEIGCFDTYAKGALYSVSTTVKSNKDRTKLSMETKQTITKDNNTLYMTEIDTVTKD